MRAGVNQSADVRWCVREKRELERRRLANERFVGQIGRAAPNLGVNQPVRREEDVTPAIKVACFLYALVVTRVKWARGARHRGDYSSASGDP